MSSKIDDRDGPVVNRVFADRLAAAKEGKGLHPKVIKALEAGDPQAVIDSLTQLQRNFAEEYIKDFNASAAVERAGYQTAHPEKMGYQQLQHPGVRYAIDALLAEQKRKIDVDENYIARKIVRALETAEEKENLTALLRAAELLARWKGMFVEKHEISGRDGEAIKMEQIKKDVDEFTSAIAGLAKRSGTDGDDGEAGA